jgi:hypothetical protein
MADYAMCNAVCPLAHRCKRSPESGAKASERQSWGLFGWTIAGGRARCPHLIDAKGESDEQAD